MKIDNSRADGLSPENDQAKSIHLGGIPDKIQPKPPGSPPSAGVTSHSILGCVAGAAKTEIT